MYALIRVQPFFVDPIKTHCDIMQKNCKVTQNFPEKEGRKRKPVTVETINMQVKLFEVASNSRSPNLPVFILPPLLAVASSIRTWWNPALTSRCAAVIPDIPQPIITIWAFTLFNIAGITTVCVYSVYSVGVWHNCFKISALFFRLWRWLLVMTFKIKGVLGCHDQRW